MTDSCIVELKWLTFTLEGFQLHSVQVYHLQSIKMFVDISTEKKPPKPKLGSCSLVRNTSSLFSLWENQVCMT